MAYVTAHSADSVNAASIVVKVPASVTGDTIFLALGTFQASTVSTIVGNNGGTWNSEINITVGHYTRVYSCVQGATPDTTVTVTYTGSEYIAYNAITVKDVDATTRIDVSGSTNSSTITPICPSVTPTSANTLIWCVCNQYLGLNDTYPTPGLVHTGYAAPSYHTGVGSGYTYHPTADATPTYKFQSTASAAATGNKLTIAIKDDGGGVIAGYHDQSVTAYSFLHMLSTVSGDLSDNTEYSPLDVAKENMSSISNGSYSTSNLHTDATEDANGLEFGRTCKSIGHSTGYNDYVVLRGFPVTETYGSTDNYDLSSSIISICETSNDIRMNTDSTVGSCFALSDETNARFWQLATGDSIPHIKAGIFLHVIDCNDSTYEMDSVGTFNANNVGSIIVGGQPGANYAKAFFAPVIIHGTIKAQGGTSTLPASFSTFYDVVKAGSINTVLAQASLTEGQFLIAHDTECGGSGAVYWDSSSQSAEWPGAYSAAAKKRNFKIGDGVLTHTIGAIAGSTVIYDSTTLNFGNYHNFVLNTAIAMSSDGLSVLNAAVTLTAHSGAVSGVSFIGCKAISGLVDLSGGNTVSNCTEADAITVASETDFAKLANCTFTGNNRAIKITGNQSHTGSGWADPNLTVSGNTYDIEYTGTSNFSIQSANALSVLNSGSGTLTIVTPVLTLTMNSDTASTLIRYFEDDSQTVVDSATGTTLAYNYPDTDVIDIEFVKQSYVPVNRQDVTPYDGDYDVIMDFDEAYNSSHGLTITTEFDYVRATKVLTINSDQSALDVRSALADVIRTNSSYYNTPLLMVAIPGLTRVDLTDGMTITSMAAWKGAGMELFDAADSSNPLEKWFSLKSGGFVTGGSIYYRQTDSGSASAVTLTNNVVDEAFQYWDDPNHDGSTADGYDYSGYMVIKSFLAGYKQARSDVLVDAGVSALQSNAYQIVLANATHAYSGSDPGISADITLIAGGTVGGKTFAYEIVDGGVNTGEDIADQLNYDAATTPTGIIPGGTGLTYFELADMVIHNGSAVETERCYEEGATPAYVGFYCSRSSADHPDFTRFQADDGTYYTPAVTSNISITGMPTAGNEIRLQVHNETAKTASDWAATIAYSQGDKVLRTSGIGSEQTAGLYMVATTGGTSAGSEPTWDTTVGNTTADGTVTWTTYAILYYDDDPASSGYADSYTDGEEFAGGDTYRVRFAELDATTSFKTYESTGLASSSGFAVVIAVDSDTVYAANGVDGSSAAVTNKFSPDYSNNEIDLDTNTDFAVIEAFAYYCYELTTTNGMHTVWGAVDGIDSGNYRNNVSVFSIFFDETSGFVKQTDSARWFRSDDTRPARDPTAGGAGLEINWRNPVYQLETGVSGLTGSESTELFKNSTILTDTNAIRVDTADMQPKLGTPTTSISADIATRMPTTHIDATAGAVDNVTTVDTTTNNTDMRGTEGANTVEPDNTTIAAIDGKVDAVKAKTDQLTFTKANELDSNIQSVNDVAVTGVGSDVDPWGSD